MSDQEAIARTGATITEIEAALKRNKETLDGYTLNPGMILTAAEYLIPLGWRLVDPETRQAIETVNDYFAVTVAERDSAREQVRAWLAAGTEAT